MWGDSGRQEQRRREKTIGERETHHPTKAHMWGEQWETVGDKGKRGDKALAKEGGHTIPPRRAR